MPMRLAPPKKQFCLCVMKMSGEILTRNRYSLLFICFFMSLSFFPAFGLAQVAEVAPQKSIHETLGSSACEKSHKSQNAWWPKNSHYQSAEPFFDQKGKHVKIARLYGINPSDMTKGNLLCMRCHGTIVSGSEKDAVTDGVGCEACHGPAKDYMKPHQEGEKGLGDRRPGRIKGLELGMVNLRDLKTRAKNCGRCHNISDARLISAGHPAANNFFDYFVDGMDKIRHWTRPLDSLDALGKSHRETFPVAGHTEVKGPPPAVVPPKEQIATEEAPTPSAVPPKEQVVTEKAPPPSVVAPRPLLPPPPPVPRPIPPIPIQSSLSTEATEYLPLPPLPKIDKTTSVEEILLIVKERLDLLYRTIQKER
jgi:hypothetical protein